MDPESMERLAKAVAEIRDIINRRSVSGPAQKRYAIVEKPVIKDGVATISFVAPVGFVVSTMANYGELAVESGFLLGGFDPDSIISGKLAIHKLFSPSEVFQFITEASSVFESELKTALAEKKEKEATFKLFADAVNSLPEDEDDNS